MPPFTLDPLRTVMVTLDHLHRCLATALLIGTVALAGCDVAQPDAPLPGADGFQVGPDFTYSTVRDVAVAVTALGNDDQPLARVPFAIYDGETLVATGHTDADGRILRTVSLPASRTQVTVRTAYLGLPGEQTIAIEGAAATVRFGGTPVAGDPGPLVSFDEATGTGAAARSDGLFYRGYWYFGPHYRSGLPTYLETPRAPVEQDFLAIVNATLPEGVELPEAHPEYFTGPEDHDLRLTEEADIRVAFVHEGAGYTNALGFYTYDLAAPPASERDAALRKHNVLLDVPTRDELILAFEDVERDDQSCDQDFNDTVFMVTMTPVSPIDRDNLDKADVSILDADGDGIADADDAAPNDPAVATYQYGPGLGLFGTLAYEDLWPGTGDYDFNDLVVDYSVRFGRDAACALTKMDAQFVVRGIGAGYRNGFALSLPLAPADVAAVGGQRLASGLFATGASGTERGVTTSAVIPVFDDAYGLLTKPGGFS